jgi:hypothetical protein
MQPVSLQAEHFLGLQRVSMLAPHFSQVKTAILAILQATCWFVISTGGTPVPPESLYPKTGPG